MNIYDALILKALGGGGGTTVVANPEGEATDELEKLQVGSDIYEIPKDYAELDNKPQINGETLSGNKTASELGLQAELDGAQTVSGNPITVTDAEPMNAESVVVELEPKQDLHGYDAPWVGGAGKNKLPYFTAGENNGIRLSYDNGAVVLNGTASANAYFILTDLNLASNNYVFSANNTIANNGVHVSLREVGADSDFTDLPMNDPDKYNTYRNVSIGRVTLYVKSETQLTDFKLPLQIEVSDSKTDFAPYSNICPITGYTSVSVDRCAKNMVSELLIGVWLGVDGSFSDQHINYTSSPKIKINPSTTYTFKCDVGYMAPDNAVFFYDENDNYLGISKSVGFHNHNSVTFTTPNNAHYSSISVNKPKNEVGYFQLELGNQATTYEPYQGNTYTIDLDGTKYGGTLDVTEGGYSDEWTEVVARSSNTDGEYQISDNIVRVRIPNIPEINNAICSHFEYANSWDGDFAHFFYNSYKIFLYIPATSIQDAKDYLEAQYNAGTPITICAKLANSTTLSTTPTDIPLLENTNNISTDGTNITLKYQPNNVIGECKAYTDEQIEKVLPPLPTTDGTYHLSCEVTSGVGVLSWVSDS